MRDPSIILFDNFSVYWKIVYIFTVPLPTAGHSQRQCLPSTKDVKKDPGMGSEWLLAQQGCQWAKWKKKKNHWRLHYLGYQQYGHHAHWQNMAFSSALRSAAPAAGFIPEAAKEKDWKKESMDVSMMIWDLATSSPAPYRKWEDIFSNVFGITFATFYSVEAGH